ncbi:class I SAM-dependent methyltransferase [Candidatus Woesearchaeota archaeon]|nr:class I SAM-dependent methyltransferase [Candidatus Woesearchaeota archaeon]
MKKRKLRLNSSEGHLGGYIYGGDPLTYYPKLWEWLIKILNIKSVLDVGCGEGHSTKYFKNIGCKVLGIDGSFEAIRDNQIPESVVMHDFCKSSFIPNKKYDMVWSCEFIEHVEEKYMKNFLETFKTVKKYLVITYAIPGQKGHHHVNCQNKEYWIKEMSKIGFKFCPKLTKLAKNKAIGHFKSKGLIFINQDYKIPLNNELKILEEYYLLIIKNNLEKLLKTIDRNIGRIGIFLKKHFPTLYNKLKKN